MTNMKVVAERVGYNVTNYDHNGKLVRDQKRQSNIDSARFLKKGECMVSIRMLLGTRLLFKDFQQKH